MTGAVVGPASHFGTAPSPSPTADPQVVRCRLDGSLLGEWQLGVREMEGELTIKLPSGDGGSVELEFELPRATSPAELGIGADTRPLGIGVEQLRRA